MENLIFLAIAAFAVLALIVLLVRFVDKYYQICEMDEALVRSGAGGARVAIQGGMWRFPIIHQFQRVTLRTLKLDIKTGTIRTDDASTVKDEAVLAAVGQEGKGIARGMGVMRTSDSLPIVLDAEVYVRVPRREEYIIAAATTMGEKIDPTPYKMKNLTKKERLITPHGYGEDQATQAILALVEEKLRSAVRGAAAVMTLSEMHTNRVSFTENVSEQLRQDLKENGLELEAFAIESLDQEPLDVVSKTADQNTFDAKAVQTLTEAIEASLTGINKSKRDNELSRTDQNKEFELGRLGFEEQEVFAREEQRERVENEMVRAQKSIEIWDAEKDKDKVLAVEEATKQSEVKQLDVAKEVTIFQSDCERDTQVAVASNEQTFELAQLDRDKTVESAEESTVKAIEFARLDKEEGVGVRGHQSKESQDVAGHKAGRSIGVADQEKIIGIQERKRYADQETQYANEAEREAKRAYTSIATAIQEEKHRAEIETLARVEYDAGIISAQLDKDQKRLDGEGNRDQKVADAEGAVAWAHGVRDADLAKGEGAESYLAYGKAQAESNRLEYTADIVAAEAKLLTEKSVAKYLLAKNAPELAGHLTDAVAAAFKPLENIDGFRILQVNTDGDGGSGGSPLNGAMKTIVNNAPAGALFNEFLQMSGADMNAKDIVEKLLQGAASFVASAASGEEVVDLEEFEADD